MDRMELVEEAGTWRLVSTNMQVSSVTNSLGCQRGLCGRVCYPGYCWWLLDWKQACTQEFIRPVGPERAGGETSVFTQKCLQPFLLLISPS